MFNQVILAGRLVKDAVMVQNKRNVPLVRICLAVQEPFRNADGSGPDVSFIDVTLWHAIAESVYQSCKKGDLVMCKARLRPQKYQTKTGETVNKLEVVADNVIFMSKAKRNYEVGNEEVEAELERIED